jgi:hypothetical protein
VRSLAGKLVVQIAAMSPMMIAQFSAASLLDGKSVGETYSHIKRELPGTMQAGLAFWPLAGVLMNYFVALKHRPAAGSAAGYFWNVYMSQRLHSSAPLIEQEPLKDEPVRESVDTSILLLDEAPASASLPAKSEPRIQRRSTMMSM